MILLNVFNLFLFFIAVLVGDFSSSTDADDTPPPPPQVLENHNVVLITVSKLFFCW